MITRRHMIGLLAATPWLARPAMAESPAVFSETGLAIRGIDPVAYFTDQAPVAGDPAHMLMWKGAVWQFASASNLQMFEMNPDAFAPQYGGYCAYALAQGALASTDPAAWTIHNERLYLNYSVDVRGLWQKDIPGNVTKADALWPAILLG